MRILLTEKQSTIRELNRSLRGKSGQRGSITPLIRWIDYGANRVAPLAANIVAPLSANELAPYWCQSTTSKEVKSAAERIKETDLSNDYSDYVMFQIYSYVNAALLEISEAQDQVQALLSERSHVHLFTKEGLNLSIKLLRQGTEEGFKLLLDMLLVAEYRITKASSKLKEHSDSGFDLVPVFAAIEAGDFGAAMQSLPPRLKRCSDITYLIVDVGTNSTPSARSKSLVDKLKANQPATTFSLWLSKINNSSTKDFSAHVTSSFVYRSFTNGKTSQHKISRQMPILRAKLGLTQHIDYLLMLLLCCESGRNREVIESIPAYILKGAQSVSSLESESPFASEPSCILTGVKSRGHRHGGLQQQDITIPKKSLLYEYLKKYEEIQQIVNPGREFLLNSKKKRFTKSILKEWKIKSADGVQITSLEISKFRKVWAGEILLDYVTNVNSVDDLIASIGEDLRNTIPMVYLLQSSRTETMLSSAIVGLQSRFINQHLEIAAQLKLNGEKPNESEQREKRFLCDCSDPYAPDFAENLNSEYCKQYDQCLGCSRAIVYEEHLPNIIYRCFQYEDALKRNKKLYEAHYEAKHVRAQQVIETFRARTDNGETLHAKAFNVAYKAWKSHDEYLLPPLIHPTINIIPTMEVANV